MKSFVIVARQIVPGNKLHIEDLKMIETIEEPFFVLATNANVALKRYHTVMPIKNLEHFKVRCFKEID